MPHLDPEMRLADDGPDQLVQACRAHGVRDRRVLAALQHVRRAEFVPPEWVDQAYRDRPIPIPHGQVTTQPSLIAQMVAALGLRGTERILEVGTGLGFQTAILAEVAEEVFSIERFADLAGSARRNLETAGIGNVHLIVGDGTLGYPGAAPFDAIVVSAAAPRVPRPLVEQLAEGGRIAHPAGPGGNEIVTLYRKNGGGLIVETPITPAHFVRLVGAHGVADNR
ncbi:MAG: protein-L-isoaspartate(D-aspartate) O-methyltransferase [Actinomycetota bacterium]|nr:protein-L-isoaspartate(D-aspartate) O-methyltransferase [Actinomycetota bacterium]